ncbi:MAG TPA: DUF4304 domain-containing protein [Puia sp.]|jgi:hypothetical protein|nr:DUF4304 domain-containing protein [Puia sp.]
MVANNFKKLVNKNLAPDIRQLGWKGSGFHFYQPNSNHVVNIFGLRGAWYGGSVCCETAIHFDFIQDLAHKQIDISKTTYASCVIRKRLSPKGTGDYHWILRDTEEENIKSINQIWGAFKTHGLAFYNDFANFPYPFDIIQPQDLEKNNQYLILNKYYLHNQIHLAWLLKEINLFIGRQEKAKEFATFGLTEVRKHADKMLIQFKSKGQQKEIEKYINTNKELFEL